MFIQFVKDRLLKLLFRRVRVEHKEDAAFDKNTLGLGDLLRGRLGQDIGGESSEGRNDVQHDALDTQLDATEGTPNRLICVPLGDGTHHLTVLHGTASQRKHCW